MSMADRISISYHRSPDAPTIPVMGAEAAIAADGRHIAVHLWTSYTAPPTNIECDVDEHGQVDIDSGRRTTPNVIHRDILATLILSPEEAVDIGELLAEQGRALLDLNG